MGDRNDLDLVKLDAIDQCERVSLEKQSSDVLSVRWPAKRGLAQAFDASIEFGDECCRSLGTAFLVPLTRSSSLVDCIWMEQDLHVWLAGDLPTCVVPANWFGGAIVELSDAAFDLRRPGSFGISVDRALQTLQQGARQGSSGLGRKFHRAA